MDTVNLEVFSGAFRSLAGRMAEVMSDTALTPAIRHCRDCSAALYSPEGKLVALADGLPLHPGILPAAVEEVLKVYPVHTLGKGDAIITNDPYLTGSPLHYVLAVSPVFYGSRLQALAASLARHEDVGGLAPGGMSTLSGEIFQEGIRIPPVRIMRKENLNTALVSLLSSNVRARDKFLGDLRAQVAAAKSAGKTLADLTAKYGPERIRRYMTEVINCSEGRMKSALKVLPAGERRIEDFIEWDGLPGVLLKISLSISTAGDSLTVDFTGTGPQSKGPVNNTAASTKACVYQAAMSAIDPGGPVNEGMFRPIKVIAPGGSLVGAEFPAPVSYGNLFTARRVTEIVYCCLRGIEPGTGPWPVSGKAISISLGGYDPGPDSYYSWTEICGSGGNADYLGDGPDGCHAMPGAVTMPAEAVEQSFPLMVNSCGLIEGSGGPGRFRGGMGIRKTLTVFGGDAVVSACAGGRGGNPRNPRGGSQGRDQQASVRHPGGLVEDLWRLSTGKYTGAMEEGASITLETPGGAGFGSPRERDAEAVRLDVLDGIISEDQAVEVYGVILTGEDLRVDLEATTRRRKFLSK